MGAAVLMLGGCAVGPDFSRPHEALPARLVAEATPDATVSSPVAGGQAQHFVSGRDVPGKWWSVFGSPELDALVEHALASNPSLQSAEAAIRVAEENALAQRGALFPQAQGSWSSARQRVSEQLASPVSSNATLFTLHTGEVSVSYLFDIFGLNRRQLESLDAQAEAQRFQRDAAWLTLAGNVVVAAIQEAMLRAQLDATREIIRIEGEQLRLMRRQLDLGAIPRLNVVAQEVALAQAEALVPPLEKQLAQQRHALAALSGRFPADAVTATFDLAGLTLPDEVPLSLPSSVVERRPDIRAAEAQLHAASAQIGVATANMLPQVTLTGNRGYSAQGTSLGQVFEPANLFWSLGAGLTQPIFQGGTLMHRRRAAQAAFDQAAAQYRSVVIGAFQNIADALRSMEIDARALQAAARAEAAARENLDMTRKQLELGDIGYLGLLSAEQAYQQAVIARVQAQGARLADTAALFQAMGGGPLPAPTASATAR